MLPIFNEYANLLYEKTGLKLKEGFYWYDNSIIKGFNENGEIVKLYRISISDSLEVSYSIPKTYKKCSYTNLLSWNETVALFQSDLIQLENHSRDIITKAINKYHQFTPVVPISTGKDSMVVLSLVRSVVPNCNAVFNNTSMDCSDTYNMIKSIPNHIMIHPDQGFYQYIDEHNIIPTRFSRFCCRIFKSGTLRKVFSPTDNILFFMGMRNSESCSRSSYADEWKNESEWGHTNWQGILPIRKWDELSVWLYIFYKNLPINPKYRKGYSRVGCAIVCPFYNKSTWLLDEYWYPSMRKRWLTILKNDFIQNRKWCILNCTLDEYYLNWNGGIVHNAPSPEVIDEFMTYTNINNTTLAEKYFNNSCHCCKKKLKNNDIALSLKYLGRNISQLFCLNCLSTYLNRPKQLLLDDINRFKEQGCALF